MAMPFSASHDSQESSSTGEIAKARCSSPSPSCGEVMFREAPFLNSSNTCRSPACIAQPRSPKSLIVEPENLPVERNGALEVRDVERRFENAPGGRLHTTLSMLPELV